MRTLRGTGALLVSGAIVLGGCGSSSAPSLATDGIAKAIASTIHEQRGLTVRVSCPRTVPRRAGEVFTCAANLEVGAYPVKVTETSSSGKVRYSNATPLTVLDSVKIERAIEASVTRQRHLRSVATCPPEVLQQAGIVFRCSVTVAGSGQVYPFRVRETDGAGDVQYLGV